VRFSVTDYADVHNGLAREAFADATLDEKRLGPRITVECEVLVTIVRASGELGPSFTAIARDLSINGIGLLQRRRPPRNARMIVQLPRLNLTPLRLLCDIAFVRELASEVFAIGATFVQEATFSPTPTEDSSEIERVRRAVID
jgi:hypothetical protein